MTGDQINAKLERGLLGRHDIKELKSNGGWWPLEVASDPAYATGVNDSVTEQAHRIDAAWDPQHGRLTLSLSPGGPGYWIPYQGNGAWQGADGGQGPGWAAVGVAQTQGRGLGTYTPAVTGGITWAVTGPFSGCHQASFTTAGGMVFAHIITPAAGKTADTTANQIQSIANLVGAAGARDTCRAGERVRPRLRVLDAGQRGLVSADRLRLARKWHHHRR